MQGELWLKVLEARDLKAVDSGGTSDPFVTVTISSSNKTLKGKIVKKNLAPQWNEEFIVPVNSPGEKILITIMDWNRFTSNVKLGSVDLMVERFAPGVFFNQWISLAPYQGEVHIMALFTPKFLPPKAVPLRLPTFRLILERNKFFPGEIVRGTVVFNVNRPREIRGVRIRFQGFSHVRWSESRGTGKHRRTVVYEARRTYFDVIATVFGNARGVNKKLTIQPGAYTWPFEFHLPEHLPPSWEGAFGRNRYVVTAYVDIPMAIDKTAEQWLQVTAHYPSLQKALTATSEKAKGGVLSARQIRCTATLPEVVYAGDSFNIAISVENSSDRPIKELVVKMYATGWFHAGRKSRCTRNIIFNVKIKDEKFPLPPGGSWNGHLTVQLPPNTTPSIPAAISPIVQLNHTVSVKAKTEGNIFTKQESTVVFPVIVGHRPFIEYVPPVVIQERVNTVTFAQVDQQMNAQLLALPVSGYAADGSLCFLMQQPVPQEVFRNTYAPEQWQETQAEKLTPDYSQAWYAEPTPEQLSAGDAATSDVVDGVAGL